MDLGGWLCSLGLGDTRRFETIKSMRRVLVRDEAVAEPWCRRSWNDGAFATALQALRTRETNEEKPDAIGPRRRSELRFLPHPHGSAA